MTFPILVLLAQTMPFPGPVNAAAAATPPAFVQASSGSTTSGTQATVATTFGCTSGACSRTAGNTLVAIGSTSAPCTGFTGSSGWNGTNQPIANTEGDTWTPLFPLTYTGTAGVGVVGIKLVGGGSGYSGTISCTINGGTFSTQATCSATQSGGVINALTMVNEGTYTAIGSGITVSISGSGGGSGATAVISAYGVPITGGYCMYSWTAPVGSSPSGSDFVTITNPNGGTASGYSGLAVFEVSNAATVNTAAFALNTSAATFITSPTFTAPANSVVLISSRVETLSQTWSATGATFANPTVLTSSMPNGTDSFISGSYLTISSSTTGTVTMSSGGSVSNREILAVVMTH
jgi:hypothetical protein